MTSNAFETIKATTAEEFHDYLRLTHYVRPEADYRWRHGWLFRGQNSEAFSLTPSVWRTDDQSIITQLLRLFMRKPAAETDRKSIRALLPDGEIFRGVEMAEHYIENAFQLYCRTQIEISLIERLLEQSLLRGISMPDYVRVREFVNRHLGGGPQYFVNQLTSKSVDILDRDFLNVIHHNSLFALAQHHGVPTRLLDWTSNPYIAAFFAAESALGKTEGNLAVFAAHESTLHRHQILNFPFPRSDNPYLYAQRGELTIYSGTSSFLLSGTYPSVDSLLAQNSDWSTEIRPKKITLPVEKAAGLLKLLAVYEGVARDQLMPTLDNIVHVVKQRFILDLGD